MTFQVAQEGSRETLPGREKKCAEAHQVGLKSGVCNGLKKWAAASRTRRTVWAILNKEVLF